MGPFRGAWCTAQCTSGWLVGTVRGPGWLVNHKRIYRLWRLEGLRLPKAKKKKGKDKSKGCSANACDSFPVEYLDHVWSYEKVEDKLNGGKKVRILNVIDEFGKECLASDIGWSIKGHDVVEVLC